MTQNNTQNQVSFQERYKFLTGSEMGAVVKHYLKRDFKTFSNFDLIASYKTWNEDERQRYDEAIETKNNFIFDNGKSWEATAGEMLKNTYGSDSVDDYTNASITLINEQYRVSATPDFYLRNGERHMLCDTKTGSCVTENLETYKYQLATQCLVMGLELKPNLLVALFFKKDYIDRGENYTPFLINSYDLQEKIEQIKKIAPMFWKDVEAGNFNFISCDEAMKKVAPTGFKSSEPMGALILDYAEKKQQLEIMKQELEAIKESLLEQGQGYKKLEVTDDELCYSVAIVEEKQIIENEEYIQKQIEKDTEKYNKKVGEYKEKLSKKQFETKTRKPYVTLTINPLF
jgi:hypothetical protein